MELCRPAIGKLGLGLRRIDAVTHRGHVVEQGVEPYIGDMVLVKGDGNAPVKTCARDGKIIQTALDKRAHLVHAESGLNKIGMLVIELEQLVLERGELEEVGLLLHALERTMAIGAQMLTLAAILLVALLNLGLGEIRLIGHAVPAVVAALIQVTRLLHALPQVLNGIMLTLLGGADKVVV